MSVDLRVWLELEIPLIEDGNSFGGSLNLHLPALPRRDLAPNSCDPT